MSFSFYEKQPDKGQKYDRLYLPKDPDNELSCQINFAELVFQKTDDLYVLTGKIASHTTGIKKDFKEYGVDNLVVIINILRIAEKKTTFKGETKIKKQSVLEKFLCSRFDNLDLSQAYSGIIRFKFDGMLNYLMTEPCVLNDTMKVQEEQNALNLTICPTKTIELEELKAGGSYGGKAGYAAKSEKDKLNEKLSFRFEQLNLAYGYEIKDFKDFLALATNADTQVHIMAALDWLDILCK